MRDRDFEEGILNPFKFGMEDENTYSDDKLNELARQVDEILDKATPEELNAWLTEYRARNEEKPVRYLLFCGFNYEREGGADNWEDAFTDLYLCAKEGERQYLKCDAEWYNVFDIKELRVITQAECAKLISDREHQEAQDLVRAYKGK